MCTEAFVMKFGACVSLPIVLPEGVHLLDLELLSGSCACFYEVLSVVVKIKGRDFERP